MKTLILNDYTQVKINEKAGLVWLYIRNTPLDNWRAVWQGSTNEAKVLGSMLCDESSGRRT